MKQQAGTSQESASIEPTIALKPSMLATWAFALGFIDAADYIRLLSSTGGQ